VLGRLVRLAADERPAALATVVRIVGSAYRRPGAKLLVVPGSEGLGSVSGGCLEGDVREVARQVLAGGSPRLLHYDTGDEEEVFGLGLGCRGQIDIFVQPATRGALREVAAQWQAALAGDEPFAVATVVAGADDVGAVFLVEGGVAPNAGARAELSARSELSARIVDIASEQLASGSSVCTDVAGHLVFVEVLQPPPHLLVCGAGDDAIPLVDCAAGAGFRITVADHREGLLAAERFARARALITARADDAGAALPLHAPARSLAVVMTHSFRHDREWTRRLLSAGLPYVGLLGSRARCAQIRRAIGADGDGRLFGPVGLDIGADGPRQVAISIVAELLAVVAGRQARHLAQRGEAIHVG